MQMTFDRIDLKLIEALQQDNRGRSTAQLAEIANTSQSVCWRRIQRLREEGVIKAEVALVDRKKIGLNAQVFAEVKLSAHGRANLTEFADAIRKFPEVLEAYVLMGRVDFLLRIVAEDIEAYERFFFEKLSRLPGVQEVNSIVALSEIKATTALPLNHLAKTY